MESAAFRTRDTVRIWSHADGSKMGRPASSSEAYRYWRRSRRRICSSRVRRRRFIAAGARRWLGGHIRAAGLLTQTVLLRCSGAGYGGRTCARLRVALLRRRWLLAGSGRRNQPRSRARGVGLWRAILRPGCSGCRLSGDDRGGVLPRHDGAPRHRGPRLLRCRLGLLLRHCLQRRRGRRNGGRGRRAATRAQRNSPGTSAPWMSRQPWLGPPEAPQLQEEPPQQQQEQQPRLAARRPPCCARTNRAEPRCQLLPDAWQRLWAPMSAPGTNFQTISPNVISARIDTWRLCTQRNRRAVLHSGRGCWHARAGLVFARELWDLAAKTRNPPQTHGQRSRA